MDNFPSIIPPSGPIGSTIPHKEGDLCDLRLAFQYAVWYTYNNSAVDNRLPGYFEPDYPATFTETLNWRPFALRLSFGHAHCGGT